jgi:hypothetical protein
MRNLSRILARTGVPLRGYRFGAGSYINGRWQELPAQDLEILGVVEQTRDEDMQNLPEGQRTAIAYTIYTDSLVKAASVIDQIPGDRFEINGSLCEVQKIDNWDQFAEYYKAIAVKVEQ